MEKYKYEIVYFLAMVLITDLMFQIPSSSEVGNIMVSEVYSGYYLCRVLCPAVAITLIYITVKQGNKKK